MPRLLEMQGSFQWLPHSSYQVDPEFASSMGTYLIQFWHLDVISVGVGTLCHSTKAVEIATSHVWGYKKKKKKRCVCHMRSQLCIVCGMCVLVCVRVCISLSGWSPWGLLCVGLGGYYVSALVAVAHGGCYICVGLGGCSPWWLLCVSLVAVARGGCYVSAFGGCSPWGLLCVSLGGCSPWGLLYMCRPWWL